MVMVSTLAMQDSQIIQKRRSYIRNRNSAQALADTLVEILLGDEELARSWRARERCLKTLHVGRRPCLDLRQTYTGFVFVQDQH